MTNEWGLSPDELGDIGDDNFECSDCGTVFPIVKMNLLSSGKFVCDECKSCREGNVDIAQQRAADAC